MCGRFENAITPEWLIARLREQFPELEFEEEDLNQINIAPTQKIFTISALKDKPTLRPMNWGIKFSESSPLIFNSRIETIKEKPFWMGLFDRNRCLVPMTAFYEWKTEGKKKMPFRIFLPDSDYFFVPGLYSMKNNEYYASLITTTPNTFIKKVHHRMPVILNAEEGLAYLTNEPEENLERCIPYPDDKKMDMMPAKLV